ncbi:ATP-binding cassette domain-containing protein [Rhodococcus rhodnii]|nr:ABC transporter ATP-binding protein [Rhodococcus rhodnii]
MIRSDRPGETRGPVRDAAIALGRLVPVLRPQWRTAALTTVVATAGGALLVALVVAVAAIVGRIAVTGTAPSLGAWAALGLGVLVRAALTWWEMDLSHSLAYRVLAQLRSEVFARYTVAVPGRQPVRSGHAATVLGDIEKLEFFYAHTLAQLVGTGVLVSAGLAALVVVDGALAAVAAAGLVALVVVTAIDAPRAARAGADVTAARSALSARVADVLGGMREVLGYGLAARIRRDVGAASLGLARTHARRERLSRRADTIRDVVVTVSVVAVVAVASAGTISPQWVPALAAGTLGVLALAASAATTVAALPALAASAARVGDALTLPPATTPVTAPLPAPSGDLGLRVRGLRFAYDDAVVLDDLDLDVAPGEFVAITGPSGAGKSTLATLLARLVDPDDGTIKLVGNDAAAPLAALADDTLRRCVTLVAQDCAVLRGTVREALLHGNVRDAEDDELDRMLTQVGLSGAIDLDATIGYGGLRLSGGQRARLCLARALLRRPRILILDEITAALDDRTEAEVVRLLRETDCTRVVVSHRPATVAAADRVVTMSAP